MKLMRYLGDNVLLEHNKIYEVVVFQHTDKNGDTVYFVYTKAYVKRGPTLMYVSLDKFNEEWEVADIA